MSEAVQTVDDQEQGISKFYYSIADHHILLESGIKTEIVEKQDVFPIPHSPVWCQGMISLRGKLIPVANLHKLLNQTEQNQSNWLLVLEKEPYPQLAIRIDRLPKQQLVDSEQAHDSIDESLPNWLKTSISINDLTLIEADHTVLFEQLIQENELSPSTPTDSAGNKA